MINVGTLYINNTYPIISVIKTIIMSNNKLSYDYYNIQKGQHSLILLALKDKTIDISNLSFADISNVSKDNISDINLFQNFHKEIPKWLEQKISNTIDLKKIFM